jgi:transcriptional regulator with XRE-family HTH domain
MKLTIGDKLRRLRKNRKLTQMQLADLIGIAPCQISLYESNDRLPSITTLEWLCEFFGITASELLGF